mgnify:CR=1 FL=1
MYEGERELTTPEVMIFGEHEQRAIAIKQLVVMPQVRIGMNPDLKDIKESLRANGLLNPIDVVVMDEFQLSEYIGFVNDLWGSEISIADFTDKQDDEGNFNLVIAGHTRTEAIRQLEEEDEFGRSYAVMAKIHKISDPAEIISLQLDENLHSKPAQERQAMAIVEAYEYGRRHERWSTPAEFARLNKGKFSRKVLSEALGFARLPDRARDFVFSGNLSYNAAVELGKSAETILDNIAANFGLASDQPIPDNLRDDFDEAYRLKISSYISHIQSEGLNSTAAKKYIQGQVILAQEISAKLRGELDENASLFDMSMLSSDHQRDLYLADLRRELWKHHHKIANLAGGGDDILRLHTALSGVETSEARQTHKRSVDRLIGAVASKSNQPLSA